MRVFINEQGKYYKAEEPASVADLEKPIINADMLAVLSDVPMEPIDVYVAIEKYVAQGRPEASPKE